MTITIKQAIAKVTEAQQPSIDIDEVAIFPNVNRYDLSMYKELANQKADDWVTYEGLEDKPIIGVRTDFQQKQTLPKQKPSFTETLWASFQLENTAVSAIEKKRLGAVAYVPDYDPDEDVQTQGHEQWREHWGISSSPEQTEQILANLKREQEARDIVNSAPLLHNFAGVAIASTLDPVYAPLMILPFTRVFREMSRAAKLRAVTGVAGVNEAYAEAAKHSSQKLRTVEESVMNVAAVTGLTYFLGKGVNLLLPDQQAKLANDIDQGLNEPLEAMPKREDATPDGARKSAGVDVSESAAKQIDNMEDIGAMRVRDRRSTEMENFGLAGGWGLEKISERLYPLARLASSPFLKSRWAGAELGQQGAYLNGHFKPDVQLTPEGLGTINELKNQLERQYAAVAQKILNDAFTDYRGIRNKNRSIIATKVVDKGKELAGKQPPLKTYEQFMEDIFHATTKMEDVYGIKGSYTLNDLTSDAISEQAAKAAIKLQTEVFDPILDEAIKSDLFDPAIKQTKARIGYWNRNWDRYAVEANRDELQEIVESYIKSEQQAVAHKYNALKSESRRVNNEIKRLNKALAKDTEEIVAVREEARDIKALLRSDINIADPRQVQSYFKMDKAPKRMSAYIRENGGLAMNGELAARDVSNKRYPGLVAKKGLLDDQLRETLYDGGYYAQYANYDEVPLDQIWDDIAADMNGQARYTSDMQDRLLDLEWKQQVDLPQWHQLGLDRNSKLADIEEVLWVKKERPAVTKEMLKRTKRQLTDLGIEDTKMVKTLRELDEFANMTPAQVARQADQIIDRISKSPNGIPDFTDFEFGDIATPLYERMLRNIPNKEVAKFINKDAASNTLAYVRNMAPEIALSRHYPHDPKFEGLIEPINAEFKQQTKIIRDNPDMSQLEKDKAIVALTKRRDADRIDITNVIKSIRGKYGVPENPNSFWVDTAQFLKAWNVTRLLGFMTPASLPDLARTTGVYGFQPVMSAVNQMFKNKQMAAASKAELEAMGVATEVLLNTRAASYAGLDQNILPANRFQRGIASTVDVFATMTGINVWNDTLKSFTGLLTQHYRINSILREKAGKASAKELKELRRAGISPDMSARMADELEVNGHVGELNYSNVDLWKDRDAAQVYKSSMVFTVDQIVLTPDLANRTLAQQTTLGGVILQLKSFGIASQHSVFLANLQARDAAVAQGVVLSLTLAGMLHVTRGLIKGEDIEKLTKPDDLALNMLDRSGLMGITFEATGILDKMSGGALDPARLFGSEAEVARQKARGVIGQVLGPSFGLAEDAINFTGSLFRDDQTPGERKAGMRLAPFGNLWYIPQAVQTATGDTR